jgi:SAM-dependent methyltransferase
MTGPVGQAYDRIGVGYTHKRRPDARIAAQILRALGSAETIVNVGAGAGSYEPDDRRIVGVEPAMTMIRQRGSAAAPVVRGYAESLPFATGAFAAAMAVLTIHHWSDWRAGLREIMRVARERVVLFTWDPASTGFWLHTYVPDLLTGDQKRFPALSTIQAVIGRAEIVPVPIPHDCVDGFLGAYWQRPAAYLEPAVRQAISKSHDAGGGIGARPAGYRHRERRMGAQIREPGPARNPGSRIPPGHRMTRCDGIT